MRAVNLPVARLKAARETFFENSMTNEQWKERLLRDTSRGGLSDYKISDLRRAAKEAGATVERDSEGRYTVYQIIAPEGKLWADGACSAMRVEWLTGYGDFRSLSIGGAIQRMEAGFIDDEGE